MLSLLELKYSEFLAFLLAKSRFIVIMVIVAAAVMAVVQRYKI